MKEKELKKLSAADKKKVLKVAEIICEELEKPLTHASLARRVKMDPRRLIRCYKIHYCMTPREAILELKGAEGCQYLLQNKLNIYEIAAELGYSTAQGFTRMFKKHTGQTPSRWQQLHLSAPRGTYPWIMKPPFFDPSTLK